MNPEIDSPPGAPAYNSSPLAVRPPMPTATPGQPMQQQQPDNPIIAFLKAVFSGGSAGQPQVAQNSMYPPAQDQSRMLGQTPPPQLAQGAGYRPQWP